MELRKDCTDRNYLYGRLLAIADRMEYRSFKQGESRETNAKKYMTAFSIHPFRTWMIIEQKVRYCQKKLKKTEGIVCDDLDDYDECLQSCGVPIFEEGMEYYYEWAYRRIKLLWNPDVLQGRMEEECEGVTRGYYLGSGWQDVPEQEREEIWEKGKDWMLLFQVGTIDGYDDEYRGEYQGNLYFWIKKLDLKMRYFENVWLILLCL